MNYEFPRIEALDDVLPALEGVDGIIPFQVGPLTCVQYAVLDPALFEMDRDPVNASLRRECRGLLFDTATGELLSRPFHKFDNIGEKTETRFENIRWDEVMRQYPKLDGSMVRPVILDDRLELMTKRGFSDVSKIATEYLYDEYTKTEISNIREACEHGLTPIYEFTGPENQVVVKYEKPALSLLAVRENWAGNYLDEQKIGLRGPAPVDLYEPWDEFDGDIAAKLEQMRSRTGEEGVVFRMRDGHMLKGKNAWYGRMHAAISNIDHPVSKRHVAALILNEDIDDTKAQTVGRKHDYLVSFESAFWVSFQSKHDHLVKLWQRGRNICGEDRKKLATEYAPSIGDKNDRSVVLSAKTEVELRERMIRLLARHTDSMTKWEEAERWLGK